MNFMYARVSIKIVFFLGALGGLAYWIYMITMEYLHDNVVVSVEVTTEERVIFPAITICNLNPIVCSKAIEDPDVLFLMPELYCHTDHDKTFEVSNFSDHHYPTDSPVYGAESSSDVNLVTDRDYEEDFDLRLFNTIRKANKTVRSNYDPLRRRKIFAQSILKLSDSKRIRMGQDLISLIKSCTFNTAECNYNEMFMHLLDRDYGNCYTFNSVWKRNNETGEIFSDENLLKSVIRTGPTQGFDFIFNLNQDEFIPGLVTELGIRILIHDPYVRPSAIFSQGINVGPARLTNIGVKQKVVKRLQDYSKRCTNDYFDELRNTFKSEIIINEDYDQLKCITLLTQKTYADLCECRHYEYSGYRDYPYLPDCYNKPNAPKGFAEECDKRVQEYANVLFKKNCSPKCVTREFLMMKSSVKWPSYSSIKEIMVKNGIDKRIPYFLENFGKVSVYFESLQTDFIIEKKKLTIDTLLSSYGGLAGLFIGFSFMSVFQVIDCILRVVEKRFDKNKITEMEDVESQKCPTTLKSAPMILVQHAPMASIHTGKY